MQQSQGLSGLPLEGRSIVVTGATSGIGMAAATKLVQMGAKVIAVGRSSEQFDALSKYVNTEAITFIQADLTQPDGLERVGKEIEQTPNIFGLIHAAGSQIVKPLRILKKQDFLSMYEIHVVVAAELMQRLAYKIGRQGSGSFVLISSVSAKRGSAGVGSYAAAKAAVESLAKTAALEYAAQGIRVNCLVPGMVKTPMSEQLLSRLPSQKQVKVAEEHPLGIGAPANVADLAGFLMTDDAHWITGTEIPVDGGFLAH